MEDKNTAIMIAAVAGILASIIGILTYSGDENGAPAVALFAGGVPVLTIIAIILINYFM
jgi:hypothetical protein